MKKSKNYEIRNIFYSPNETMGTEYVVEIIEHKPSQKVQKLLAYSCAYISDKNKYEKDFSYPITYFAYTNNPEKYK